LRYVDLAVAAIIGTSAIAGIAAWDPRSGDAGSRQERVQMQLRSSLLDVLQEQGILWLIHSPPGAVCSYLADKSNSTFGMAATLGSVSCGVPPRSGSVVASLEMRLVGSEVSLVAWSLA